MTVQPPVDPQTRTEDGMRQLSQAATPGPWGFRHFGDNPEYALRVVVYPPAVERWEVVADEILSEADAEFIAAARTAVPELLDELSRLRTELDAARAETAEADRVCRVTGDKLAIVRDERNKAEAALRELIRLKDGPRDDAYRAAKEAAWAVARGVVSPSPFDAHRKVQAAVESVVGRIGAALGGDAGNPATLDAAIDANAAALFLPADYRDRMARTDVLAAYDVTEDDIARVKAVEAGNQPAERPTYQRNYATCYDCDDLDSDHAMTVDQGEAHRVTAGHRIQVVLTQAFDRPGAAVAGDPTNQTDEPCPFGLHVGGCICLAAPRPGSATASDPETEQR